MSNVKISDLPAASSLATTDIFPLVQSSLTKQGTFSILPGVLNVVRVTDAPYNAVGDGSTNDAVAIQAALDTGKIVFFPYSASGYRFNSTLSVPVGGGFMCETKNTVLSYGGAAGTYAIAMQGTATTDTGSLMQRFTLKSATDGVNGIKLIECRRVRIDEFEIRRTDNTHQFAIGILLDDSASTAPQLGSAWNHIGDDHYIEYCTDAGVRLTTSGAAVFCNRNYIGFGQAFGCGTGYDIQRASTNRLMGISPQGCTTSGLTLGAEAQNNIIIIEEESCTASVIDDASSTNNFIYGYFTVATASLSSATNSYFVPGKIFPFRLNNNLRLDVSTANATIDTAPGFTGSLVVAIRNTADASTNMLTFTRAATMLNNSNVRMRIMSGGDVISGSGSPESSITAGVGSIYLRTDGAQGSAAYYKASGAGNTGWVTSGMAIDTAANIADKTASINTADKKQGRTCYDTTNHRIMVADGSTDVSAWWIADGSGSVTPA